MRKKNPTNYGQAVLVGFALGLLFVLITPRCQAPSSVDANARVNIDRDPGLAFVIDSLRAEGFAVVSHYPVYVRFVKNNTDDDPVQTAISIAKALQYHTGVDDIKAQLDLATGTYLADPNRGIIDPSEILGN